MLSQTWTLRIDDAADFGPFLLTEAPGVPVEVRFEHDGRSWRLTSASTALAESRYEVRARIERDGQLLAEPTLIVADKGGVIEIGGDPSSGASRIRAKVRVESGGALPASTTVPRYPAAALKAGMQGQAILRVRHDASGTVIEAAIETSSGHAALDAAAVDAVRNWRFNSPNRDGEPAGATVLVPVRFQPTATEN